MARRTYGECFTGLDMVVFVLFSVGRYFVMGSAEGGLERGIPQETVEDLQHLFVAFVVL